MESGSSDSEDKKEKDELNHPKLNPKFKIIKNKTKNYLFNLISHLINNKNFFEEKLTPSDIEIIFETSSEISTYSHLGYKTKLNYRYFNPKRDLLKNVKLYKNFPAEIEMKDEYYQRKFDEVSVDLYPEIKKGMKLNLSDFPFFSYENKELKQCDKNELNKNTECACDEYVLCIYINYFTNVNEKNDPIKIIENILQLDSLFKYFKTVFIIFQFESASVMKECNKEEKLIKYLNNNENKNKIFVLYNLLSSYQINEKNKDNVINIFTENKKLFLQENKDKNYYFILDQNKRIIEASPLNFIGKNITLLLMELKDQEKKGDKNNIFAKKEKEEKAKIKQAKKLIQFITDINKLNLDYLFDIYFKVSFTLTTNDELTKIQLTKINLFEFKGKFKKNEYNYLKNNSDLLKANPYYISFSEIPTVDIDIDFTNMECEKCKKVIGEESYLYYCYICKMKYCYECVQSQLKNNTGKKKYIDPKHNLIFFKTRDKNHFLNIDQEKLGNNLFAELSEDSLRSWSSARCDGCSTSFRGQEWERYLCLTCKKGIRLSDGFIDFCSECVDKMSKDKRERENLEKKPDSILRDYENDYFMDYNLKIEHKHEKHIYLMMPYQVEYGERGYYTF